MELAGCQVQLTFIESVLMRTQVAKYAKDPAKFDSDFTKAFQKLEELGTSNLTPTAWA